MLMKSTSVFSSFLAGSLSLSLFCLSSNALASEEAVTKESELKITEEETTAMATSSYPVINMDEAQFAEGFEDMKDFLNAANFDPLKVKAYGSPDAPLTLYNFSSYSCSHCKNFHSNGLSQIQQKYIISGKLRVVFANIAFDQLGLFLTSGSFATKDLKQYMSYSSAIYENQGKVFSQNAEVEVKKILDAESINFEDLYNTATNPDISEKMMKFLDYTSSVLKIDGTPTFILTKTGHSPEQSLGRVEGNEEDKVMDMIEKELKAF